VGIFVAGILLGTAYNALGMGGDRPWALRWIASDPLAGLPTIESAAQDQGGGSYSTDLNDPLAIPAEAASDSYSTNLNDPLAIPGGAEPTAGLPQIPAVGRPVRVELPLLRQYFDAGAAVIVDARDAQDYAEGHIPGAINLPYDDVISDASLIDALETGGRPVITYCGGAGCEVSLGVAEELCNAGFERVAVYAGGFPEWVEQGNPVAHGERAG
jgi:rhodanese-related sulfurtransferase